MVVLWQDILLYTECMLPNVAPGGGMVCTQMYIGIAKIVHNVL